LEERDNLLQSVKSKLVTAHAKNADLEAQYAIYGTLSDVACVQRGNRISLQRFVLRVLLDDVLIQASQRLLIMSKSRYRLVREGDRTKGNTASGLDLEVEDSYTGKTRSVAHFRVENHSWRLYPWHWVFQMLFSHMLAESKLDTLFIDEGFGSLDCESLDLAIKTLIDLQAAGRMIGILSHVTELRSK